MRALDHTLERRTATHGFAWINGPVRLAVNAMGTRFEIVLAGQPAARLRAVGEAAIEEIVACHRRFTRFSPDSLLSHIVRTAHEHPVRLDADTFALFEEALRIQHESGGAFNIAVGDGVHGYTCAGGAAAADSLVDSPAAFALDADARTVRLTRAVAALDLGAIAKGHALDLAARVLRENRVDCALLHGGTSSVIGIGAPPGMRGWRIALAEAGQPGRRSMTHECGASSPEWKAASGKHQHGLTIELTDRALSVTSTTGPFAWRASPHHHIRDGRDGGTVAADRVVAVAGPSARGADAWSTALAVLGARPACLGAEWFTWMSDTSEQSEPLESLSLAGR